MIGSKLIAMIAAVVAVVGVTAAGVYVYWQQHAAPPSAEGTVATGESPTPASEQPKPQSETKSETVVPSFDVVRIEPSGEGVIAGRAEPGWHVSVENHGTKVAEAIADEEGAWSVILEKPLPAGDHSLSVKAASPDGVRGLTSQQSVAVAVGKGEETVAALTEPEPQSEVSPPAQTSEPEPAAPAPIAEEAAAPASPSEPQEEESGKQKQPPVRFKTVDYEDKGDQPGKIVLTGTGNPGARILLFFDDEPFGQVIIGDDGTWRFEKETKLPNGEHVFRADLPDETTGIVMGRASIGVRRMEPAPEAKTEPAAPEQATPAQPAPATAEAKPSSTPEATPSQAASPQVAAAEVSKPAVSTPRAHRKKHRPRVYTIRRGDTLWALAERFFGGGSRYVTIYRGNRKHIRDPNRIYPRQKVHLPKP